MIAPIGAEERRGRPSRPAGALTRLWHAQLTRLVLGAVLGAVAMGCWTWPQADARLRAVRLQDACLAVGAELHADDLERGWAGRI